MEIEDGVHFNLVAEYRGFLQADRYWFQSEGLKFTFYIIGMLLLVGGRSLYAIYQ